MRILRIILLCLTNIAWAQEHDILTIYSGFENPLYFINTKGNVILILAEGDRPVTFLDYMPTMEKYTGLQSFHEGVCIVHKRAGGFLWLDKNCRIKRVFDSQSYTQMFPFSQGYSVAEIPTSSYRDRRFVFLDSAGVEAFNGKRFSYATPFFNDSSLVQMEGRNGEWGYMDLAGIFKRINNDRSTNIYYNKMAKDHSSRKRLLNKIDDEIDQLLKAYKGGLLITTDDSYKQFVLQHHFFTNEYQVVDIHSSTVIWSTPVEYINFRSLKDANAHIEKVTRLTIGESDLDEFPKVIYEFKNLTHLTLHYNGKLTEIPHGISALKNLRYLTLDNLWNLKTLPDDMIMLKNLEMIQIFKSGRTLNNFVPFVESSLSLKTVNTINYNFPSEQVEKARMGKSKIFMNIEFE